MPIDRIDIFFNITIDILPNIWTDTRRFITVINDLCEHRNSILLTMIQPQRLSLKTKSKFFPKHVNRIKQRKKQRHEFSLRFHDTQPSKRL